MRRPVVAGMMHQVLRKVALPCLLALLAVACGGDDGRSSVQTGERDAEPEFCERWRVALRSESEQEIEAVLVDAPPALEEVVSVALTIEPDGELTAEQRAASEALLTWTELNCTTRPEGSSERFVGAPVDSILPGLTVCGTDLLAGLLGIGTDESWGQMAIYGDPSDDPYAGRMLGLLWGGEEAGSAGDGDPIGEFTVHGERAVVAPITVFQQTVLPELGIVVAWTENGRGVSLYGRGWSAGEVDELLALAESSEITPDGAQLPAEAVPTGFQQVYAGAADVLSVLFPAEPFYTVRYAVTGGQADLKAMVTLSPSQPSSRPKRSSRLSVSSPWAFDQRSSLVGALWWATPGTNSAQSSPGESQMDWSFASTASASAWTRSGR